MKQTSVTSRGGLVILFILSLAVFASLASLRYLSGQQQKCLKLWGPRAARLIRQAPQARAWRVEPYHAAAAMPGASMSDALRLDTSRLDTAVSGGEIVEFGEMRLRLSDPIDVAHAPGFSHVRQALTHDRVFDWSDQRPADGATWRFAVRFTDGDETATVLFAFDIPRVALLENGATVSTAPVAGAFDDFFNGSSGGDSR